MTNQFVGTNGDDAIGESGIIYGLKGNDILAGRSDNDTIYAGQNNDTLYGDGGDDFLRGDRGDDLVYGNDGNDTLHGGKGNDSLYGGEGDDILFGGDGSDTIIADSGDVIEITGDEGDLIFAQVGTRIVNFRNDIDTLTGGNFRLENGVVVQITISTPVAPVESPIFTIPTPRITTPTPTIPDGVKTAPRNGSLDAAPGPDILTGGGNSTLIGATGDPDSFVANLNTGLTADAINNFGAEDEILLPASLRGRIQVIPSRPGVGPTSFFVRGAEKIYFSVLNPTGVLNVATVESSITYI